jgi:transcriptional regulator with XRE-family HTH domain
MPHFGQRIREARLRHALSQERLALRASTTQEALSRIERGELSPRVTTAERILAAMGESLGVEPLPLEEDPRHLATARALDPASRLQQSFAWNAFAESLRGKARG